MKVKGFFRGAVVLELQSFDDYLSLLGSKIKILKTKKPNTVLVPFTFDNIKLLSQLFDEDFLNKNIQPEFVNIDWLLDFQKEDVGKISTMLKLNKSAINASVLGSGKTFVALGVVKHMNLNKTLIICPNSLKRHWLETATNLGFNASIDEPNNVTIINYEKLIAFGFNWLFEEFFDIVIADEAHKLKNNKAKRTKSFNKLKRKYTLLLTGTPVWNKPENFFNLLRICAPIRFSKFVEDYVEKYFNYKTKEFNNTTVYQITGVKDKNKLLFDIKDIYIRRERSEILDKIPKEVYERRYITLSDEERKIYDEVAEKIVSEIQTKNYSSAIAIQKMLRSRQAAVSPALILPEWTKPSTKILEVADIVDSIDEQIVVFTTFKKAVELLAEQIPNSTFMHGDFSEKERNKRISAFKKGKFKTLIMTHYVGSEGLNLQNASVAIFVDRDYVPELNHQAKGRIVRLGQMKKPVVIDIVAERTIDETIIKMIENKISLKDEIVLDSKKIEKILYGSLVKSDIILSKERR